MDLFEKWPGERYADHARNNVALQSELRTIFKERTVREWLDFARQYDTTIAPHGSSRDEHWPRALQGFLRAGSSRSGYR